jgi:hypothetical protein
MHGWQTESTDAAGLRLLTAAVRGEEGVSCDTVDFCQSVTFATANDEVTTP